jgi:hypothetical protein
MTMVTVRRWHFYIGMFIAPSLLFFALTGAAQLFNLHEAHGTYDPPPIIEKLSSVHKDQVFAPGHHHRAPAAAAPPGAAGAPAPDEDRGKLPTLLLKLFFLVVALGLAVSTAMGLWIGLTRSAERRIGWALLLIGAALPLALLLI